MVGHISDDKGHFLQSRQLAATTAPVSGHDLITVPVLFRAGKAGHHHAVGLDGRHRFLHFCVIPHLERMGPEGVERVDFGKFQIDQLALLHRPGRGSGFRRRGRARADPAARGSLLRRFDRGLVFRRGVLFTSGHFVSRSGRLALAGGRLVSLGWAATAGGSRLLALRRFIRGLVLFPLAVGSGEIHHLSGIGSLCLGGWGYIHAAGVGDSLAHLKKGGLPLMFQNGRFLDSQGGLLRAGLIHLGRAATARLFFGSVRILRGRLLLFHSIPRRRSALCHELVDLIRRNNNITGLGGCGNVGGRNIRRGCLGSAGLAFSAGGRFLFLHLLPPFCLLAQNLPRNFY